MQPALIAALLLVPPADDFCDGLKRVVEAAPRGFAGVGGQALHPGRTVAAGDVQLPDTSLRCLVRADFLGAAGNVYDCEAGLKSARDSGDVDVLAERVGKCLGTPMIKLDQDPALKDFPPAYGLDLPQAHIMVSYTIVTNTAPAMNGGGMFFYLDLRVSAPEPAAAAQ